VTTQTSVEPSAVTATGPEVIQPLVDVVRRQAVLLSDDGPGWLDDPLSYAWLCCLEAATRVGQVLDARRGRARVAHHGDTAEELREAFSATRAAAATVRFALFGRNPDAAPSTQDDEHATRADARRRG